MAPRCARDLHSGRAMPSNAANITPPALLEPRQVLIAFSGLVLVLLLAALDSTIVATALPTIVSDLGGLQHLAWVVTGYLLAQTVVTPIYGKLGDLYGRKIVLQMATVLFLAGSALCGLSRSMTQLILFRAIQGLGGGGLTVTSQAVVGDIVPPIERGRYQGIFGAVYGLASVAGPLLGGYFTTRLSWHWIFYINLPFGILALFVLAATLPSHTARVEHAIDYWGALTLAVFLTAITLVTDLGGTAYNWSSPFTVGLIAIGAFALGLFLLAERRAPEPVIPLRLFRNRTFALTSAIGLIIGFALFGSVTYLPVFLQVVKGATPTASGLELLPMMLGLLGSSITSGQLISRTGRYRIFPIIGTFIAASALAALSRITPQTTMLTTALAMLGLGIGIGMVMQVLVIAVQNAVDYRDLGVATSGATLFRLVGGSLGTALLGAVFAVRLTAHLKASASALGAAAASASAMNAQQLARLAPAARTAYMEAFTHSLDTVFVLAATVCAVGFLLTLLLPEQPLRRTVAAKASDTGEEVAETFARPLGDDSEAELLRGLQLIASRDVQRAHIASIVRRAGLSISPGAAWLLVRIDRDPTLDFDRLASRHDISREGIASMRRELEELRWIEPASRGDGAKAARWHLTTVGCDALTTLIDARRAHLADVLSDWPARQREEIAARLRGLAEALVPGAAEEAR